MTVNKSFIILKGGIGNTRFYKRIGTTKNFAGNKGGPTLLEFQTLPSLARMRENASESSVCFTTSSLLSNYLILPQLRKAQGQSRTDMFSLLKSCLADDTVNPPGERTLFFGTPNTIMARSFTGAHFSNYNFGNLCNAAYTVLFPLGPSTFGVQFTNGIATENWLKYPRSATHYRLALRGYQMYNWLYDPLTKKYYNSGLDTIHATVTGYLPIVNASPSSFNVIFSWVPPGTGDYGFFLNLSVIFYQLVGASYQQLKGIGGDVMLRMDSI